MTQGDSRITHLAFDMAGVLVKTQWHEQMSNILGRSIAPNEVHSLWGASDAVCQFECGATSFDEFTKAYLAEQNVSLTSHDFQASFTAILQDDFAGVTELLRQLKPHFTLCLLSNSNEVYRQIIKQRQSFLPLFDAAYFSCELGVMKPSPHFFQTILALQNVPASQVLFFDDGLANVEAARKLDMEAEQVFGPEDVKQVLTCYGLTL